MKLLLTATLIFIFQFLLAQNSPEEYHLLGIDDNVDYKIRIEEDLAKDLVLFSTNKDGLLVYDVRQVDTVISHLKKFLEVKFIIRGGTGIKNRERALLCVEKGKLFMSLLMTSDIESRITEVYDTVADSLELFDEESQYHVGIEIEEKNNGFMATLIESKYVRSKFDPTQNESFENTYRLNFDRGGYYFFNSSKNLNDKFRLYSHQENKHVEKFLSTEAPAIELTSSSYFFIDGIWYDEGLDNYLFFRY